MCEFKEQKGYQAKGENKSTSLKMKTWWKHVMMLMEMVSSVPHYIIHVIKMLPLEGTEEAFSLMLSH